MPVPTRVAALVASPVGRQIALAIIEEVQLAVNRDELELLGPTFVEPLLEATVRGETIRLDTSDEAGRFGEGDWMFVVIVPLVVNAMERLLGLLAAAGPNASVDDTMVATAITPNEVRRIVRFVGSRYAQTQVDSLAQALQRSLDSRLETLRGTEG